MSLGIVFGVIAVVLGQYAQIQGDWYGSYGMLFDGAVHIIGLVTMLLTTIINVETGYYRWLVGEREK